MSVKMVREESGLGIHFGAQSLASGLNVCHEKNESWASRRSGLSNAACHGT